MYHEIDSPFLAQYTDSWICLISGFNHCLNPEIRQTSSRVSKYASRMVLFPWLVVQNIWKWIILCDADASFQLLEENCSLSLLCTVWRKIRDSHKIQSSIDIIHCKSVTTMVLEVYTMCATDSYIGPYWRSQLEPDNLAQDTMNEPCPKLKSTTIFTAFHCDRFRMWQSPSGLDLADVRYWEKFLKTDSSILKRIKSLLSGHQTENWVFHSAHISGFKNWLYSDILHRILPGVSAATDTMTQNERRCFVLPASTRIGQCASNHF